MSGYVLVIMLALSGHDYRSAGGVTVETISGFATEQECINASRKLKYPNTTKWQGISYSTSCIPMSL